MCETRVKAPDTILPPAKWTSGIVLAKNSGQNNWW
jgi:hypothetical protein